MFHQTNIPLIEFHGYGDQQQAAVQKVKDILREKLPEDVYKKLVISTIPSTVTDIDGKPRPFLRFHSTEFALQHDITNALRDSRWIGEIEFHHIRKHEDLRAYEHALEDASVN